MRSRLTTIAAGASLLVLGTHAAAQGAPQAAAAAPAEAATLGEIVVTARRKSESLQEVPQTVNAVTADTLQKLNITTFQDIQRVVPGLSLKSNDTPTGSAASLRGVNYSALVGGQPTVATYINDAPTQTFEMFTSLFDIGQIEVLKGPQGTTRGIAAPSGAITLTTHRPDLSQMGGYVSARVTDHQGRNAEGALNIPIIKDVLAVRVAGVVDNTDNGGVRSINSALRPYSKTTGERVSVSFEPNDAFNANISYQHLDKTQGGFAQVFGQAFGTNPTLSADQRAAVAGRPSTYRERADRVTALADSHIFGQHLSYVGSYANTKLKSSTTVDPTNQAPGAGLANTISTAFEETTHEIRLASDPAPGRLFDYTVGAFYSWQSGVTDFTQPVVLFPGAFGPPNLPPNTAAFDPKYAAPFLLNVFGPIQETSLFGSVTLHLGSHTELSGGIRHIINISTSHFVSGLGSGTLALPASFFGGNCAAAHFPSTYPGFCDFTLNLGGITDQATRHSERPNIYNVSLSHHITRDLLVYANTGTSWGEPLTTFGLQGAITQSDDPLVRAFTFHPPVTSRAYEVGVKSTFLDGRARLNLALFRQRFRNLYIGVPGVFYFNPQTNADQQGDFSASVNEMVQGVDLDAAWQVTPEWNVAVQASYAHAGLQGASVPCNLFDAAGHHVYNRAGLVSVCSGGTASRLPLWNITAQTEYVHPVSDGVDGFVRGLLNYNPENKYVEPNYVAPGYSLADIYLGVRSHDGAWEASIFTRNAFNTNKLLDRKPQFSTTGALLSQFPTLSAVQPTYYEVLGNTSAREVGVSIRYAWGSR